MCAICKTPESNLAFFLYVFSPNRFLDELKRAMCFEGMNFRFFSFVRAVLDVCVTGISAPEGRVGGVVRGEITLGFHGADSKNSKWEFPVQSFVRATNPMTSASMKA